MMFYEYFASLDWSNFYRNMSSVDVSSFSQFKCKECTFWPYDINGGCKVECPLSVRAVHAIHGWVWNHCRWIQVHLVTRHIHSGLHLWWLPGPEPVREHFIN